MIKEYKITKVNDGYLVAIFFLDRSDYRKEIKNILKWRKFNNLDRQIKIQIQKRNRVEFIVLNDSAMAALKMKFS